MSKVGKIRKRKAPVEASNETVVYMPKTGPVKVSELKAKLAVEAKVAPAPVIELEKAVVGRVVEKGGRVTRAELTEILVAIKQEKGVKRGVTLSRLMEDKFLARIKVPRMRAFYAATEEGARRAGIATG